MYDHPGDVMHFSYRILNGKFQKSFTTHTRPHTTLKTLPNSHSSLLLSINHYASRHCPSPKRRVQHPPHQAFLRFVLSLPRACEISLMVLSPQAHPHTPSRLSESRISLLRYQLSIPRAVNPARRSARSRRKKSPGTVSQDLTLTCCVAVMTPKSS
jgi:hypothetical protein